MKQSSIVIFAFSILTASLAFGEVASSDSADNLAALRRAQIKFAVDAYSKAEKGDSNFFFSPMSIYISLGMVYGGARGETEKQLATALQTDLGQEMYHRAFAQMRNKINDSLKYSRVRLNVAKLIAIQANYPLQETFVSLAREHYDSEILQVDFQRASLPAQIQLNAWIEKHTNGKIKGLLGGIEPSTRLILLNAIYFKATWEKVFSEYATQPRPFWVEKTKAIEVPTMYQKEKFLYGESDLVQVLKLPYLGKAVSMILVLPRNLDGLDELEATLNSEHIDEWMSLLAPPDTFEVQVYLPRFEMETDMALSSVLCAMGAIDLFSATDADLSAISTQQPLFFSTAIHRAGVIVDEKGTEAWAATGEFISMGSKPKPPPRKVFRADHPFLFFIVENSQKVILFMGRVANPEK